MLMTFSKAGGTVLPHVLAAGVNAAVEFVSNRSYNGNILCSISWARGRRVRFTLETRDARAYGSRKSSSGRHMRKASWEAHRDVLEALFLCNPDATIKTALATYRGRNDFVATFPDTANRNIGSQMSPRTMPDCSIEREEQPVSPAQFTLQEIRDAESHIDQLRG